MCIPQRQATALQNSSGFLDNGRVNWIPLSVPPWDVYSWTTVPTDRTVANLFRARSTPVLILLALFPFFLLKLWLAVFLFTKYGKLELLLNNYFFSKFDWLFLKSKFVFLFSLSKNSLFFFFLIIIKDVYLEYRLNLCNTEQSLTFI